MWRAFYAACGNDDRAMGMHAAVRADTVRGIAGVGSMSAIAGQSYEQTTAWRYRVYGVALCSDIPLALQPDTAAPPLPLAHVAIQTAPANYFRQTLAGICLAALSPAWGKYVRFPDRSTYFCWNRVGEFVVSGDGRTIHCRRFDLASDESFQIYLIQRALSIALVEQGYEPLHATAIVVGGRALAFLGDAGTGKSTLAAFCLNAGDTLLTDDLLLLRRGPQGFHAYPGAPRLKLFPLIGRQLFGQGMCGTPMNPDTGKLIVPIDVDRLCQRPVPLRALYLLQRPHAATVRHVQLETVTPRAALIELVRHTFNYLDTDPDRLARQFLEASQIAMEVEVKRLVYPRLFGQLAAVREALLADAHGEGTCGFLAR
jgi:hypothetical protein